MGWSNSVNLDCRASSRTELTENSEKIGKKSQKTLKNLENPNFSQKLCIPELEIELDGSILVKLYCRATSRTELTENSEKIGKKSQKTLKNLENPNFSQKLCIPELEIELDGSILVKLYCRATSRTELTENSEKIGKKSQKTLKNLENPNFSQKLCIPELEIELDGSILVKLYCRATSRTELTENSEKIGKKSQKTLKNLENPNFSPKSCDPEFEIELDGRFS
ncbi:unnamed protein product [Caenorhabditis angaria]|uniref:C2 domain-containing protein n=1 Tax=Caenorhabditis angaria TaxID=860376 RepID=A0A9P1IXI2_9PELO|nr:unnamed protein product [Caenorhabditis angaria]